MPEELIYAMTSDEMRRLRAIASQLQGGSDRERDIGHRLWLVLGEVEASGIPEGEHRFSPSQGCQHKGAGMSMHPLFQLITDNFREIPEKIAAASVADSASERASARDPNGGPAATPDYAGNHGGDSSKQPSRHAKNCKHNVLRCEPCTCGYLEPGTVFRAEQRR